MYEKHKMVIQNCWKCNDQQQYKTIIDSEMVSTPDGFTDNIPISTRHSVTVKHCSARKSLCRFSEPLDIKSKTSVHKLGAAK